jgi:hypothetical protein
MICKLEAINFDKNLKLVIEKYENFGSYLLVYDLSSGKCIKDHLYSEDQLDGLYYHAKNIYGVDKEEFHLAYE